MTLQQYEKIRDCWVYRMTRLRKIAENENEGLKRQKKAFSLWFDMSARVMLCDRKRAEVIAEITKPDYWKGSETSKRPMMIEDDSKETRFNSKIEKILLENGIHASSGCRNSITDFKKGCDGNK